MDNDLDNKLKSSSYFYDDLFQSMQKLYKMLYKNKTSTSTPSNSEQTSQNFNII